MVNDGRRGRGIHSPKTVTAVTSVVVFAFGFTWLVERVLELKLLSN